MSRERFDRPVLLIDTREQQPLPFALYKERFSHIVRATLKTGDYSIFGYEDRIAIERKSLADLTGSLTHGRDRFFKELERLAEVDRAVLLIEATAREVHSPYKHTLVKPASILGSLHLIAVRFNVNVVFAGTRAVATQVALAMLEREFNRD